MLYDHRLDDATPFGRLGQTGGPRAPPDQEATMTRLRWDRISFLAVNCALWGMIFIIAWKLVR